MSTTLRFRHSAAITVAAIIMMIAGVTVARWQPYLLILLIIPFAVAIWGWRAGTDVDATGITVHAALGRRRLAWSDVAELRLDHRGRVEAGLISGNRVTLTAVPAGELATVLRAAGMDVVTADQPGPDDNAQPGPDTGARISRDVTHEPHR